MQESSEKKPVKPAKAKKPTKAKQPTQPVKLEPGVKLAEVNKNFMHMPFEKQADYVFDTFAPAEMGLVIKTKTKK